MRPTYANECQHPDATVMSLAASDNIRDHELAAFKMLAAEILAYAENVPAKATGNGTLTEVVCNDQPVS